MSIESLMKLSELRNELEATTHLVSIIHTAADSGCIADEADVAPSIFCAWQRLWDISSQFSDIIDAEFAERRAAK